MHQRELEESSTEQIPEFVFREGEYTFVPTGDGVICRNEENPQEEKISYSDVKIYRSLSKKSARDGGKEKLYFTAPVPSLHKFNRYRFREGGKTYITHEFTETEKEYAERAVTRFKIDVIDKKTAKRPAPKVLAVYRENGGLARKIVVASTAVLLALLLGAVIMYLINYFLHTNTGSLAAVFGIFCVPCLTVVLVKSQELGSKVKFYDTGVYLKIRKKSGFGGTVAPIAVEEAYFDWDEIECVERVQIQARDYVRFRLGYAVYTLPDFSDMYEFISRRFPDRSGSAEESN